MFQFFSTFTPNLAFHTLQVAFYTLGVYFCFCSCFAFLNLKGTAPRLTIFGGFLHLYLHLIRSTFGNLRGAGSASAFASYLGGMGYAAGLPLVNKLTPDETFFYSRIGRFASQHNRGLDNVQHAYDTFIPGKFVTAGRITDVLHPPYHVDPFQEMMYIIKNLRLEGFEELGWLSYFVYAHTIPSMLTGVTFFIICALKVLVHSVPFLLFRSLTIFACLLFVVWEPLVLAFFRKTNWLYRVAEPPEQRFLEQYLALKKQLEGAEATGSMTADTETQQQKDANPAEGKKETPHVETFFEKYNFAITLVALITLCYLVRWGFSRSHNDIDILFGTSIQFLWAGGNYLRFLTGFLCVVLVFLINWRVLSDWQIFGVKFIFEQIFLSVFFLIFCLIIVNSFSLLSLFVGIVGVNLSLYSLIGQTKSRGSTEAAIKYLVLGVISIAFFLLGILFLLTEYGVVDFSNFYWQVSQTAGQLPIGVYYSIIVVLFSLFFKLAVFPLSNWVAEVYEGSSVYAVAKLVFSKIPVLFMLSQVVLVFPIVIADELRPVFVFSALGSLVLGAVAIIFEQKIKRFFALSGVTQMGFVFGSFLSKIPVPAISMVYIGTYAITSFSILVFGYGMRHEDFNSGFVFVSDLSQVSAQNISYYWTVVNSLFSFSGLPPFIGFFTKFSVLVSMLVSVEVPVVICLFFYVIFTPVTAFNYMRLIKATFFTPTVKSIRLFIPFRRYEMAYLTVSFFFFYVAPLYMNDVIFSVSLYA